MPRLPIIRFSLAAFVIFLAACANNVAQPMPQMTFAQYHPIPINVRTVDAHVVASRTSGNFITDPGMATESYLRARFAPRGLQGTLEVTVEEASVTKEEKPSANSALRFMNVGGQDVYNMTLRIRFEHIDQTGRRAYGKVLRARREMNISEHASIAERERHELLAMEKMFADLDYEVSHMVVQDMRLGM